MDYYKRYMGDYGRDTSRLSMMEHGAYSLLLDDYYSTRAPLPADMDALYRVCRAMSKQEQAAVASVAKRFFPVGQDGLRHSKRADEEIAKWEELTKEASESGKRGAEARWGKRDKRIANPMRTPDRLDSEPHADPNTDPSRVDDGGNDGGKNGSPAPIPDPNPEARSLNHSHSHTQSARAREGNGSEEARVAHDTGNAWRDAGCDAQAYEAWLAYRAAENDYVPDHVRLYHATFLRGKGTPEEQRTFVANLIQRQFKRLHEPGGDTRPSAARATPKKRWHPDDGDPTEPKAVTP